MATLQKIKKRIKSLESTEKMTSAMKQVSAVKFRRAQQALVAARPYSDRIGNILHRIASRAPAGDGGIHPLLHTRPIKRVMLMVLTSDRGMCGAFNTNLIRSAEQYVREHNDDYDQLSLGAIGKKGHDHFKRIGYPLLKNYSDVFDHLTYTKAANMAENLAEAFVEHELDAIYFMYHEFKTAVTQKVVVDQLLPIKPQDLPEGTEGDYLYEPDKISVLERLVPRYIATQVWRTLLETSASEHGARMTAMDAATDNAIDMRGRLVLEYNRARQEAITTELMDIVSGAEALR